MPKKSIVFSNLKDLGERLKNLREEAKLSQNAVAHELKITDASIVGWEKGTVEPRLGYLEYLSQKCKCNLDWLLTGEGEKEKISNQGNDLLPSATGITAGRELELLREKDDLNKRLHIKDNEIKALKAEVKRLKRKGPVAKEFPPRFTPTLAVPAAPGGELGKE
jgi:transcriptional regulator with XRE-family HTH domain